MKERHIQHLYWRAGFGIHPKELKELSKQNRATVVEGLFRMSQHYKPLEIDLSDLDAFSQDLLKGNKIKSMEFGRINLEKIKDLNLAWTEKMVSAKEILREKMTLFWANHFVVEDNNALFVQHYNNTLRKHALGQFGEFVKAISKEAAMVKYLNNKQNRKQNPNENFARELMELFTLGAGNYTEEDIKESARAFTGYDNDFDGNFVFQEGQHDWDFKYFFGKSGRYEGDDVIDIILKEKQCARFICDKIYRHFVNDKAHEEHVEEMANVFYEDYNIENLMRHVFLSDWFYEETNIGTKIKSPIELVAGIQKVVPTEFETYTSLLVVQRLLGQILFNPPNVAGWKGGQNWINSNTILLRLKLASILLRTGQISTKEKGDYEKDPKHSNKGNKHIKTIPHWDVFNSNYKMVSFEDLQTALLLCNVNNGTKEYVDKLSKTSKKDFCVQIMSLPEYQMC